MITATESIEFLVFTKTTISNYDQIKCKTSVCSCNFCECTWLSSSHSLVDRRECKDSLLPWKVHQVHPQRLLCNKKSFILTSHDTFNKNKKTNSFKMKYTISRKILPNTVSLYIILAGNLSTERCKNQILAIQMRTEICPFMCLLNMIRQFLLSTVQKQKMS